MKKNLPEPSEIVDDKHLVRGDFIRMVASTLTEQNVDVEVINNNELRINDLVTLIISYNCNSVYETVLTTKGYVNRRRNNYFVRLPHLDGLPNEWICRGLKVLSTAVHRTVAAIVERLPAMTTEAIHNNSTATAWSHFNKLAANMAGFFNGYDNRLENASFRRTDGDDPWVLIAKFTLRTTTMIRIPDESEHAKLTELLRQWQEASQFLLTERLTTAGFEIVKKAD